MKTKEINAQRKTYRHCPLALLGFRMRERDERKRNREIPQRKIYSVIFINVTILSLYTNH